MNALVFLQYTYMCKFLYSISQSRNYKYYVCLWIDEKIMQPKGINGKERYCQRWGNNNNKKTIETIALQ